MDVIIIIMGIFLALAGNVGYCAAFYWTNSAVLNSSCFLDYAGNATARIIDLDGVDLHNSSQRFYPAFVNFTMGKFAFSILMRGCAGDCSSSMKVVWTAHTEHPVEEDALLGLMPDGTLVLSNPDGSSIWSAPTSGTAGASLSLGMDGALAVLNSTHDPVWRSFQNPSDSLLPGQTLLPCGKLTSRAVSSATAQGPYSLVMAASGLALYFTTTNDHPQPYWMWGAYGNNSFAINHTCNQSMNMELQWQPDDQLLQALLFPNALDMSSEYTNFCDDNSAPAGNHSWVLARLLEPIDDYLHPPPVFLRLDPDGNLRLYSFSNSSWQIAWEAISDKCLLAGICKEYGVCKDGGTCDGCPVGDNGWAMKAGGQGCTPVFPPSCSSNGTMAMLTVTGMDYFAMPYLNKTNVSSSGDCKTLCSQNCSCAASFYYKPDSYCVLVDGIQGSLRYTGDSSFIAFLKLDERDMIRNGSNSSSVAKIAAGVAASVMALAILAAIFTFYQIRRRKSQSALRNSNNAGPDDGSEDDQDGMKLINLAGAVRFSYAELESATKGFEERLGRGGFGSVYRGLLPDGRAIAVKKLEGGASFQGQKEFYSELATLSSVHHWNLVQLYGFCVEKSERLLVYEYFAKSSLDKWLFQSRGSSGQPSCHLSWASRYKIAVGVAKGLAYLHDGCQERIIHLDIKPQNVLLNDRFEAKVTDFGLSRLMGREQSQVITPMMGTPGYVAPEWLLDSVISDKNDVYSYGLVLLELISGHRNFNPRELRHNDNTEDYYYFPAHALRRLHEGRAVELIDPDLASNHNPGELVKLMKVGLLCVQEEASKRPRMECIVQMLEGEKGIPDPPSHQDLHCFLDTHLRMLHSNATLSFSDRLSFRTPTSSEGSFPSSEKRSE